jgi:hypothetical protein
MEITVPAECVWLAVEVEEEPEKWVRVPFHGGRVYFPADKTDPRVLLRKLAPGLVARIVFCARDRRRVLDYSEECTTGEAEEAAETPAPEAAAAAAHATPPPAPPPNGGGQVAWPVNGQPFPAPAGSSTVDPLTQLFYVTSMVEKQQARQQELLIHFITAGMEREANRTQQMLAMLHATMERDKTQMQQHYQALDAVRADRDTKIEELRAQQHSPLSEMAEQIGELAQRLEDEPEGLAPPDLTENSTDAERFMAGIERIVTAVASSPLGGPLGDAIAKVVQARAGVSP